MDLSFLKDVFLDKESIRIYKLLTAVVIPLAIVIAIIGDGNIVVYVNTHRPKILDPFFAFYTDWGNYIMLFLMICFLVVSFLLPQLKEYRPLTLSILVSGIFVNLLVVRTIKVTINRTRPHCVYGLEVVGDYPGCGKSFPSGHTSEAFTYATNLMMKFKQLIIKIALLTYAILMGFSRIYAGVHYPFDVLAGGTIAFLLSYWIYRIIDHYRDEVKESNYVRIMVFGLLALVIVVVAILA